MKHARLAWLVFLAGITLFHCRPEPETYPDAPVILISIDTLRADHLSVYGNQEIPTPNIDALAADGVTFTHAFSHVPLTLPSHASLFTGMLPGDHGVRHNLGFSLDEGTDTLAERLKANGYSTAGVVSAMVLRRETGISQGFDTYQDDFSDQLGSNISQYSERRGDVSVKIAEDWLQTHNAEPFFLFLHLFDPHAPYNPPVPYDRQNTPYAGEIAFTDHLIGRLIDSLKSQGIYDRALIVFLSDHGEGLGDHGEDQHGLLLYREALHVPLIVKLPENRRAKTHIPQVAGLMDVATTITELLGLGPLGNGTHLLRPLKDDRRLYAETMQPLLDFGWYASDCAIEYPLHLIRSDVPRLFDMERDFDERQDLFGGSTDVNDLPDYLEQSNQPLQRQEELSVEEAARLESLGYVSAMGADTSSTHLDEEAFLNLCHKLGQAKLLLDQKRLMQATKLVDELLEAAPGLIDAHSLRARILGAMGLYEDSKQALRAAQNLAPQRLSILVALVDVCLHLRQIEEAEELSRIVLEMAPQLGPTVLLPVLDRHDHFQMASDMAQRISAQNPDLPLPHLVLARHHAASGSFAQSKANLDKAVAAIDPATQSDLHAQALFVRGFLAAQQNQAEEALMGFRDAIAIRPDDPKTQMYLFLTLFSLNRRQEARDALHQWTQRSPSPNHLLLAAKMCDVVGLTDEAAKYRQKLKSPPSD